MAMRRRCLACSWVRYPLPLTPDTIDGPGGSGAVVHHAAVQEHGLKLFDSNAVDDEVVLFRVGIRLAVGQALREEDVVLLVHDAVPDVEHGEVGHAGGDEAGLFLEFAAGKFFRVDFRTLPASLGELDGAALDGVAELLDEVEEVAFGRVRSMGMMRQAGSLSTTP